MPLLCLVMQDQHVPDDKTGYVFIWRICCQIALVSDHSVRTIVSLFMQSARRKLKEDGADSTGQRVFPFPDRSPCAS